MTTTSPPLLAAIVIARNEERWIGRCLDAVLDAVDAFAACDVVVVDSASSDETVAAATQYPVTVVELRTDAPLSPALARRVGEALTRSRYVLFVDGDTEIDPTWVAAAVDHLERNPRVAGVGGKLRERYYERGRPAGENPDCFGMTAREPEEVEQLGGNALYRRSALEAVGSFNPFVVSYEEAELAERLRRDGGVVVRLPIAVGVHHTGVRGSLAELQRRLRENLIKGYGQTLRLALHQGTFRAHAHRMRRYLEFIAVVLAGMLAALVTVATGHRWPLLAWCAGVALALAALVIRSRSLVKPARLVLDWSFWAVPLVRGFFERPRAPDAVNPRACIARIHEPAPVAELARCARKERC